jgi:hypothetical protein
MILYNFKSLKNELTKTELDRDARWIDTLLRIVHSRSFRDALLPYCEEVNRLFDAGSYENESENADYEQWVRILRSVGRTFTDEWRTYDALDLNSANANLEDVFDSDELLGRIDQNVLKDAEELLKEGEFKQKETAYKQALADQKRAEATGNADERRASEQCVEDSSKEMDEARYRPLGIPTQLLRGWPLDISGNGQKRDQNREREQLNYARQARNFVWLLAGLAPNLPAIIHAEVMAHVYEAEWLFLSGSKVEARRERRKVQKMLEVWADFVGTLAVSFRYIKIKSLLLFAKLFLDSVVNDESCADDCVEFLKKIGVETDHKTALRIFRKLHALFAAGKVNKRLAMMPDAAPATLFGEEWMIDLITDDLRKQAIEKIEPGKIINMGPDQKLPPLTREDRADVPKGLFGETEQWLWATNRCLRKFNEGLRLGKFYDDLDSSKATGQLNTADESGPETTSV